MAYKKTANLTDSELDEQVAIQEQGIADKRICTPIRLNNLLDERIRDVTQKSPFFKLNSIK